MIIAMDEGGRGWVAIWQHTLASGSMSIIVGLAS